MHRLIPCIALGLLASCENETKPTAPILHGVILPKIGSAEALAAQASFRAWYDTLPGALQTNLHQEHQFHLQAAIRGSRSENFQLEVEAEILSDIGAMDRMRFDWKGVITGSGGPFDELLDGMPLEFGATFLMADDQFWARGETYNTALAAPPGTAGLLSMEGLDSIYKKTFELTLRDAEAMASEFPGMLAYTEEMVALYPDHVSDIIHPTGFLRSNLPFLTCRRFEKSEGVIDAYLAFDMQEGTEYELALQEINGMLAAEGHDVGMAKSVQEMFLQLPEIVVFHLRLDATHGNILLSEISMRLDSRDFGGSIADGILTVDYRLEGEGWQTPSMPDSLFAIDEDAETFDLTPFVPLMMNAMEFDIGATEADEDFSF